MLERKAGWSDFFNILGEQLYPGQYCSFLTEFNKRQNAEVPFENSLVFPQTDLRYLDFLTNRMSSCTHRTSKPSHKPEDLEKHE